MSTTGDHAMASEIIDIGDDSAFMDAWGACAAQLHDAALNMASLLKERAKTKRPPNLVGLQVQCDHIRDILKFSMSQLDAELHIGRLPAKQAECASQKVARLPQRDRR